jgi:hypothetical protein
MVYINYFLIFIKNDIILFYNLINNLHQMTDTKIKQYLFNYVFNRRHYIHKQIMVYINGRYIEDWYNMKYFKRACKINNIYLIYYIFENYFKKYDRIVANIIISYNLIDIYLDFKNKTNIEFTHKGIQYAIGNGYFNSITELSEQFNINYTNYDIFLGIKKASMKKNTDIIKYIIDSNIIQYNTDIANNIISYGHTNLILYFIDKYNIKYTRTGIIKAIANGYFNAIRTLAFSHNISYDDYDIEDGLLLACKNGNLKTLISMKDIYNYTLPKFCIIHACLHIHLLEYFEQINLSNQLHCNCYECASGYNNNTLCRPYKCENIIQFIDNNDIDTLKYIYYTYNIQFKSINTQYASKNGYLDILKFLCEECNIIPSIATVDSATKNGHLHILEYLFNNYRLIGSSFGIDWIIIYKHTHIYDFIKQNWNIDDDEWNKLIKKNTF